MEGRDKVERAQGGGRHLPGEWERGKERNKSNAGAGAGAGSTTGRGGGGGGERTGKASEGCRRGELRDEGRGQPEHGGGLRDRGSMVKARGTAGSGQRQASVNPVDYLPACD